MQVLAKPNKACLDGTHEAHVAPVDCLLHEDLLPDIGRTVYGAVTDRMVQGLPFQNAVEAWWASAPDRKRYQPQAVVPSAYARMKQAHNSSPSKALSSGPTRLCGHAQAKHTLRASAIFQQNSQLEDDPILQMPSHCPNMAYP